MAVFIRLSTASFVKANLYVLIVGRLTRIKGRRPSSFNTGPRRSFLIMVTQGRTYLRVLFSIVGRELGVTRLSYPFQHGARRDVSIPYGNRMPKVPCQRRAGSVIVQRLLPRSF